MSSAAWVFDLARHDESSDPSPVDPPATDSPDDPPEDPPQDQPDNADSLVLDAPEPATKPDGPDKGTKGDDKDWKAEADKWKALARKHETSAKANAAAATKLGEIEDAQKSEAERLAAAKEAAEQRAAAATERAVWAEVKAHAADFVDPSDARSEIKPAEFVSEGGEIDVEAIRSKLAEILDAKPHWRKPSPAPPQPAVPPKPKPDPGQGARGDAKPANFKDVPKAEFAAELAKHRLRARS